MDSRNVSTGGTHGFVLSCLDAIFAGAALLFHIRAYIIVPITGLVAMWALYRIMVFKDSRFKANIIPGSKIRRADSFLDTIRHKQSSATNKIPKPTIRT
jgi:hypothetical protein